MQTLQQVFRRKVDELNFVGLFDHAVRERFLNSNLRDLGDRVVKAFKMLNIQRRVDVNVRRKQFFDILIPSWGDGCLVHSYGRVHR